MLKAGDRVMVLGEGTLGEIVKFPACGMVQFRAYGNETYRRGSILDRWPNRLLQLPLPKEPLTEAKWLAMNEDEQRAYVAAHNIRLISSSGADEMPTRGFGELDDNGYFEFPCWWDIQPLKEAK